MKPIIRRNIIVWPVIPVLTSGVKLHDQSPRDPCVDNVAVLPVVRIERKPQSKPEPTYNDIQAIVAKTMRGQRPVKHNPHVIKKLRAMFKYPA